MGTTGKKDNVCFYNKQQEAKCLLFPFHLNINVGNITYHAWEHPL